MLLLYCYGLLCFKKKKMTRHVLTQEHLLSQFFTNDEIVQRLIEILKQYITTWDQHYFIEPSAGDGAFLPYLPDNHTVAVEVDPVLCKKHPRYIAADLKTGGFLGLTVSNLGLQEVDRSLIVTIGNPPYSVPKNVGRSNNIALKFVNHACSMGDTVAMILPNTFRRPQTQSKIDSRFHLVYDMNMPAFSFTMGGKPKHVTTVFQIWQTKYSAGNSVLREVDPILKMLKKGKWGGDWYYVRPIDKTANVRVCNWGSCATVGEVDGPEEVQKLVQQNCIQYQQRIQSHALGQIKKVYDPDQSHWYLHAENPVECVQRFRERRYLFGELAVDRATGHNPDLSHSDVLRIYLTAVGTHYVSGKWIQQ